MAPLFPLEEFKPSHPNSRPNQTKVGQSKPLVSAEEIEKTRLAGFEAGYQAGWDDGTKSETDGQSRIGAEFARNLQDLGFTFHEARSHVMHALEPLLAGMVEKVLPKLVADTIGQSIVEELLPLASTAADKPIEVVVPPSARPVLEPMLIASSTVPFVIIEEPTLAEGQVFLRSGKTEKHLDLSGAVDRIGTAINDLYDLNERVFQHG
ncbi:MAG: flagellar biosynthesis protein [Rhodobacteraceae bacterium]|nr:flagellar biosynthesis protein [Paracoccaceae bacterium]